MVHQEPFLKNTVHFLFLTSSCNCCTGASISKEFASGCLGIFFPCSRQRQEDSSLHAHAHATTMMESRPSSGRRNSRISRITVCCDVELSMWLMYCSLQVERSMPLRTLLSSGRLPFHAVVFLPHEHPMLVGRKVYILAASSLCASSNKTFEEHQPTPASQPSIQKIADSLL